MQKRSSRSVKVTYFHKEAVWQALRSYVTDLVQARPEVRRVIVFGSLARDEAVPGSDVDLLLVLASADRPFLERPLAYKPYRFPVGVEVFAYTGEELEQMLREGNFFLRRALAEGITLFQAEAAS